jgi:signal transduction histidine kinase
MKQIRETSTIKQRSSARQLRSPGRTKSVRPPEGRRKAKSAGSLARTTINQLDGEQLRDFATRLEAVREEERTRVAREIHDELGQALTVLKMDLSWLQSKSPGVAETRKRLGECIKKIDETIDCVRRISSELRPSILDNLGLVAAIDWQVSEFRKRTGIRVRFKTNVETCDVSMSVSVALFRVVQEALTNVMRHANATRVDVTLKLHGEKLQISIADNGVGMKQNRETELRSLGIVGMKERISRIGGEFNLLSEPEKGTWLDIAVPVDHDQSLCR